LDTEEAIFIKKNAKNYFADHSLAANLIFIKFNFGFNPDIMTIVLREKYTTVGCHKNN